MLTKVTMPQMGESIFESTITKWLKKVGEAVMQDEPLFEISTDKVDSEIPAPASGILSEILVPEGKTVKINTPVAIIKSEDDEKEETAVSSPGIEPDAQETPKEEPGGEEQTQPPIKERRDEEIRSAEEPERKRPPDLSPTVRPSDIRTSPLVRKLAREHHIDLSKIQGTGLEGRITKDDVLDYLNQEKALESGETPAMAAEQAPSRASETREVPVSAGPTPPEAALMPAPEAAEEPRFLGETETVPMTHMRKAIAEHMVRSKRISAHVNTVFEVDMTSVVQLRERHKSEFEKREGIPLTYTPFFVKALVDTVRDFPIINSSISGENIIYKKPINVGIAVALDSGLIVPVLKNAHLKSLTGLALAIHNLAERARTKRLKPDDVKDGTISITNPGNFGALFATPIISQPQVAILGIGGIEKRPVVINDAIAIRSMVCLSLSYDHRAIDGAIADQFMAKLKARLQSQTEWID